GVRILDLLWPRRQHGMVLTEGVLREAVNASEEVKRFRVGVKNCDLPVAEAIAAAVTSEVTDADWSSAVPWDVVVASLKSKGFRTQPAILELGRAYLEFRHVLTPTRKTEGDVMVSWNNQRHHETLRRAIRSYGDDYWVALAERHATGEWRKHYAP